MEPNIPQIYNPQMRRLAYLQNARDMSYEKPLNALWTAAFSIPAEDPKNEHCRPFNFVKLYDGTEEVGLFRIIGLDLARTTEAIKTYQCEHVLATLLNDVLFQYHQIGNVGVYTPQVLRYIIDRQSIPQGQSIRRWRLGQCDFSRQFEYKWENENLLAALFSVPTCFDQDYKWEWDTTGLPWVISLKALTDQTPKAEIRYGKNMVGITKTEDATSMFNRIYPLGYGEGVNQLTIKTANNNIPHLDDPASIATYGLISTVLSDSRFENAASLKGYAQTLLGEAKDPYITYEVEALDLFRLTGAANTKFNIGDMVRVIDQEDNINVITRIANISKSNVRGDGGNITVTLANKAQDIAGSISDLQNRMRINEVYSQGATNVMMQDFSDNADANNPASFRVYIPAETARINKMRLTVGFAAFRGYSKAIKGGGATSATTENGGSTSKLTSNGGGDTVTSQSVTLKAVNMEELGDSGPGYAKHNHGIPSGVRLMATNGNDYGWVPSGAHNHEAHEHTVKIPNHDHDFSVPNHKHDLSLPAHTHDIEFGIFTGSSVNQADIIVDGTTMPRPSSYDDIDIVAYLSKDNAGRIQRNTWHTVQIKPVGQSGNTTGLTRVVASLFTQLFTNSRGGGDY